jgi:hypothetical protein
MKIAGVPVEFKVATILEAIMALLPIPEMITLPLEAIIQLAASGKSVVSSSARCPIALRSISIVRCANSIIVCADVNVLFNFMDCIPKRLSYL